MTAAPTRPSSGTDYEALPCPFCGTKPYVAAAGYATIHCRSDDCFGPRTTAQYLTDALRQWNTRAQPVSVAQRQPHRDEREALAAKLLGVNPDTLRWSEYGYETQQHYLQMADVAIAALSASPSPSISGALSEILKHVQAPNRPASERLDRIEAICVAGLAATTPTGAGEITEAMIKAGAAAMCCQAKTLGCAAKNKDSEFSTCMVGTFMEDARRCLAAAMSSTPRKAPASCPDCKDETDCANVDICNATEESCAPSPTQPLPPDWKQDQAETSRLAPKSTEGK